MAVNSTDRGLSALGSAYQEPYLQRKTNLLEKPWATYDGFSARGVVCECHSPVRPEDVWLQPFQRPAFCGSAIPSSGMVAEPGRKCDKKLSHLWLWTTWKFVLSVPTSFCINCHLLHKTNLTWSDMYTNLCVERSQFRRQFDIMVFQQNNNSRFIQSLWAPKPSALGQIYRTVHASSLVELALNLIRKKLITP